MEVGGLVGLPQTPLPSFCFFQVNLTIYTKKCELYTNFTGGDLPNRRCLHPCMLDLKNVVLVTQSQAES